jgi:hypothetical protein
MGMRTEIKIGKERVGIKLSGALAKAALDLSLWDGRDPCVSFTVYDVKKISNELRGIELEGIDRYKRGLLDVWLSFAEVVGDELTFS